MAKLFVGSLPDGVSADEVLRAFQKYGRVTDCFVKPNCAPTQQCAFVTFATAEQAKNAKEQTDRQLMFPESTKPCEVMVARNQGIAGRQTADIQPAAVAVPYVPMVAARVPARVPAAYAPAAYAPAAVAVDSRPRKVHVGTLPDGIQEWQLAEEFSKYGEVTDIMIKENCPAGKQWAFVTFERASDAHTAKESTDRTLLFPGATRPCEVVMARNQGLFGQGSNAPEPVVPMRAAVVPRSIAMHAVAPVASGAGAAAGSKLLVGSLPDGVHEDEVRAGFEGYGRIVDIFVKPDCTADKQWAFVTFATPDEAAAAKAATDRVLYLPGSSRACEVMYPRGSGGGGGVAAAPYVATSYAPAARVSQVAPSGGPNSGGCKIFVGSMPGHITDAMLREEFSRYGDIVDAFIKVDCEPNRQWGFVTYSRPDEAMTAKECTDRVLVLPGADRACEVMIAKSDQRRDAAPAAITPVRMPVAAVGRQAAAPANTFFDVKSTSWRQYFTPTGLPYYHNAQTGVTQWEAPANLPVARGAASPAAPHAAYGAAASAPRTAYRAAVAAPRVVPRKGPY